MLGRISGARIDAVAVALLLAALGSGPSILRGGARPALERIQQLESLAKANDWKQAASLAAQWTQDEPEEPRAFYWLGIAMWQQERRVESIQALRKAELRGFSTAEFHLTLGRAYYAIHQFSLFRQQMQKAAVLGPNDPQPHFQLGRYFDSVVGDYQQALGHYRKAAELAPRDGELLYHVGFCQEMLGQREEARATYQSSSQLVEEQAATFSWPYQRMAQLSLSEDAEGAIDWARRAVAAEPGRAVNHYVMAKAYLRNNQPRNAVEELLEAVRLDPKDPSARYLLATAYTELGQGEQARQARFEFQRLRAAYGSQ
jgi:Flp pilus assembly protein TadD